jgi:hypothetical protein
MTLRTGAITILTALVTTTMLPAQVFLPGNPYVGGFGVGYTRVTPNSVLQVGFGTRGIGFAGYGPPFAPGYCAPWGYNAINQSTVIINPPGYNPLTGWPAYPRGILIDPLAVEVLPREFLLGGAIGNTPLDREIDRIRESLPRPLPDPNRGLLPRDREEDRIEVRIDRQPRAPVPPPVAPVAEKPKPDRPAPPLADPQAEYLRLVTDGKLAFGKGEYGRAAERFGQALSLRPADAPAWFLRSQARVALGKYLEAAEDLREGLRRFPEGLVAGFNPRDLYGEKVADYAEHRQLLEQTSQRFAADANLTLLAAVQCWLAGNLAEARARMEKIQGADRPLVESFLQAANRMAAAPR